MSSVTNNLKAWWNVIWHHFVHGTLPAAPQPGGNPVIVAPIAPKQTPPAPELPNIAPQHVDQANSNLDLAHGIPSATLPTPETVPAATTETTATGNASVQVNAVPAATNSSTTTPPAPAGDAPPSGEATRTHYAKPGDVVYPGVRVAESEKIGLVLFDVAELGLPAELAGVGMCCYPLVELLDPASMAHASVIWNTSSARMADFNRGDGMIYMRVDHMVEQDTNQALAAFAPKSPIDWVENADSVGAEFNTWPLVIERLRGWNKPLVLPPQ